MKKKNVVLSLALAGILAVGAGTYAYMSSTTARVDNVFTVGKSIEGELKEPTWDGGDFTNDYIKENPIITGSKGEDLAKDFVPSRVIPKDPKVANTSEGTDAWIAVTISYPGDANSKAAIEKFAEINWNEGKTGDEAKWVFNSDYTIAYYKDVVKPVGKLTAASTDAEKAATKTTPLFTQVKIKDEAKSEELKNFKIDIQAYLVQAEGFNDCQSAMQSSFADVFNK